MIKIDRLQDEIKTGDPEQLEKSIQQTWMNTNSGLTGVPVAIGI